MSKKTILGLINYVLGTAKLSILKTRKNELIGIGGMDPVKMLTGIIANRLKILFSYYALVGDLITQRKVVCRGNFMFVLMKNSLLFTGSRWPNG